MRRWQFILGICSWVMLGDSRVLAGPAPGSMTNSVRTFMGQGVVMDLKPAEAIVVIRHEAIGDYMAAMTMPFKAKNPADLTGLSAGDKITFRLQVSDTESRVDDIVKTGAVALPPRKPAETVSAPAIHHHPLLDYKFTNELGQAVSLNDFHGQALAITFFYTRCPLPDFCPRLSKNFQEASTKLLARPGAPMNWHFISVSIDPEFDTPEMLKTYAGIYQADPAHWSFLTGPTEQISQLANQSGVTYRSVDGSIDHNFRTLIVDPNGHLQMVFPTGGDLSDMIVQEILKAAAVTNQLALKNPTSSKEN
jgi:protein SCO1/2